MGTFSDDVANAWLNTLRNVAVQYAAVWVKLHIGDPGAAGTTNAAANTSRQQATLSAASGRALTNSAQLEWLTVSTTETYSWVSLWTASTAGTFLGRDDLSTAVAMTAGGTFRIVAGDLDFTIN